MRISLAIAAFAAILAGAVPAAADAPAAGFGRRPAMAPRAIAPRYAPARPDGYRYGAPRRHHHRHYGYGPAALGPAAGGLPPFYTGMGDGAAYLEGQPVGLTLYREAYIGRGIFYNTPPTLDRPDFGYGGFRGRPVLSSRY